MTIGERIKAKREEYRISQTDLANRVGITKQSLYKYEKGIITNIPSDTIELLAAALHCSPGYIMGWDEGGKRELHIRSIEYPPEIMEFAIMLAELSELDRQSAIQYIKFLHEKEKES